MNRPEGHAGAPRPASAPPGAPPNAAHIRRAALLLLPLFLAAAFRLRGDPAALAGIGAAFAALLYADALLAALALLLGRRAFAARIAGEPFVTRIRAALDVPRSRAPLSPGEHATGLLLLAIGCGALLLRVWNIDILPVSYDERAASRFAAGGGLIDLLRGIARHDCHPPLFYLLQHLSESLPPAAGDLALRAPTLAAGTLAPFALYGLAVRLIPARGAGLLAAALLAVNPWHIHLSRTVRMYPLLVLLAILAMSALLDLLARRPGAARRLAAWCALALLTHYMAVWLVASLLLAGWCADGRAAFAGRARELLRAGAPWLLLLLPWGMLVASSLLARGDLPLTYQLPHPPPRALLETVGLFDWGERASRLSALLPWLFLGAPLLHPAVRAARAARLLYALLLAPLLLNYLFSTVTHAATGAGIYQPTHAAYALIPALLLLVAACRLARARAAVLILAALLLVRPLAASLELVVSAPPSPYETAKETAGRLGGHLFVTPPAFALEARKPGEPCPEWLHLADDAQNKAVAGSLPGTAPILLLEISAGEGAPPPPAGPWSAIEAVPSHVVTLPHPTRPARLSLHGGDATPVLAVRFGRFRAGPSSALTLAPDAAERETGAAPTTVHPYHATLSTALFRWPAGASTIESPPLFATRPRLYGLVGGDGADLWLLLALLLALAARRTAPNAPLKPGEESADTASG